LSSETDNRDNLSDYWVRQQALDTQQSYIVSAPAGSGKTGLITQRVLGLLCSVENPEEILCITFTRKAASEMKGRIHKALLAASDTPRPEDDFEGQTWDLANQALTHNNKMGWDLLRMPSRLRIKTIDSFCNYVSKQFALESKLGSMPQQSEFPIIYYHMAARELLQQLEGKSETAKLLRVLVQHMGNDLSRCEKLLADMLGKREQWLPHIYTAADNQDYFQQVIAALIANNLEKLAQQIAPIAGELVELADFAACHVSEDSDLADLKGIMALPDTSMQGLAQWQLLLKLLVTGGLEPRKRLTAKEGFPPQHRTEKERMKAVLDYYTQDKHLQALVIDALYLPNFTDSDTNRDAHSDTQQPVINALAKLLPQLVGILKLVFQQHNLCDYPEITLSALEALNTDTDQGDISDITLRLDYQLKHILVDEFQDTSGSQIQLLEHLVGGWQEGDGRTLFLVGDAMQSLYSFRDARVGLFINAQEHPIGNVRCKPLYLDSNFRSNKGIVDWVNANFIHAFPDIPDINRGAVPYNPSVAVKPGEQQPAVHFHGIISKQKSAYEQQEAEQIADLCQSLKREHPQQSVAILVRNRGHLRHIIPALKRAQLHWDAVDIDPLADLMPVIDMMSLTRALLSPADRVAWLAILRAPFCGLGLADLLALSNAKGLLDAETNSPSDNNSDEHAHKKRKPGPISIIHRLQQWQADKTLFPQLSDQGNTILNRVAPLLIQAWDNRHKDNLRTVIERLWVDLGGPATLLGDSDITDIRTYLDLLEKWQVAGTIEDWSQFQKAIEKLFGSPSKYRDESGSSSSSDNKSNLQIMTIHKAKGLEFDQVILPGLNKPPRADDNPLLRWQEEVDEDNKRSLLIAALGPHDEDNDPLYAYLKYEQSARVQLENARVLYVAATRAIKQLHLFASVKATKDSWQKPGKTTLLAALWPSLKPNLDALSNPQAKETHNSAANTETNLCIYQITKLPEDDSPQQSQPSTDIGHYSLRRLPPDFKAITMPDNMMGLGVEDTSTEDTPKNERVGENSIDSDRDLDIDLEINSRARHQGTALHRTLKQIALEGLENWPLERRQQLPIGWATQLKQQGIIATDTELDKLSQSLESMLADDQGQWVLQPHTDHQSEYALSYFNKNSGQVTTSIIDRTFVADGTRWIIDYKYSSPEPSESLEEFAQRQTQQYQSQLNHYAFLFSRYDSKPVRCALYFPSIALFHEVYSK
jgi:ATP-dependent helicase/nuclease subunit A